jgi:hypothetical protein
VLCRPGAMIFVALLGSSALAGQNAVSAKKPESTKQAAPSAKLQIDPKAVDILKASSEKLAGAKTLSFTAEELFERLSRQDAPLAYTNKYEVTLQPAR